MTKSRDPELEKEFRKIHQQFTATSMAAVAILVAGAIFYHIVEKLSWLNSFYFCTITLTTVGYGDIVPTTPAGKLFTMGYVIVGIGILATFANVFIKNAVARREMRRGPRSDD